MKLVYVFAVLLLTGCSTMDSFGDKGSCKATVEFECDCDCQQSGSTEEILSIVK